MANESGGAGCIVLGIIGIALYSCSQRSTETKAVAEEAAISGEAPAPGYLASTVAAVNPVRADFNEDRAEQAAHEYLAAETYEGEQGNMDCTDDCTGHQAGWDWAANGNDCEGGDSSGSFTAGCLAFATATEEKVDAARVSYDGGDDTFAGDE